MKKFFLVLLILVVTAGAVGYWRGWFNVTTDGKVGVQVDSAKFKQDKDAFSKTVGEKAKAIKDQVASLWKTSEGLAGDERAQAQKELGELNKKHERLEQQIKELEGAGQERFDSIKQDLTKALEEVERKIQELTTKLEKTKAK